MVVTEQFREPQPGLPQIYTDLIPPELVDHSLENKEDSAQLAADGALVVSTGEDTGRSPRDKYIVRGVGTEGIDFSNGNNPLEQEEFNKLGELVLDHYRDRPNLYRQNLSVGADSTYARNVQVVSENAWSSLFIRDLLRPYNRQAEANGEPISVYHAPSLKLNGEIEGVKGDKAIAIDINGNIIIAGTRYAGEIKKSIFTLLQGLLPQKGVVTLHCSAVEGALFFGLSGTGKTTLSMDTKSGRKLIGDDEHAWTDTGVFNLEGGSYAKVINLSRKDEPEIWKATQRYGSVLENVDLDENGNPIFSQGVENMRGAFPLSYFPDIVDSGMGGHPGQILFLTADATGVMPLAAKLDYEQALYHFGTGYTSRLAGTKKGITEPEPDFSACYGKPFLMYPPARYVEMFGEKLRKHGPEVWLINTGWPGGYGKAGRVPIEMTREIVRAILAGEVSNTYVYDGMGNRVPQGVRGILPYQLRAETYFPTLQDYKDTSRGLALAMHKNSRQFVGSLPQEVLMAGPHYQST